MQFMVIETFRDGDARAVYERFLQKGRQLPDGVDFIDSWVSADLKRCFQIMQCEDPARLQQWVSAWADLVDFEIVPVTSGREAAAHFTAD